MKNADNRLTRHVLRDHGITDCREAHWNVTTAALIEQALARGEGSLAANGALLVRTGQFTGRSPKDKYLVREPLTEHAVDWGAVNQPMSEAAFERLRARLLDFWNDRDVFVQDCLGGADPAHRISIRVIAQRAWHALFARQLFVRPTPGSNPAAGPDFTVYFAPGFQADPALDGTRGETCIALSFKHRAIIIAGTEYAGEMKKSIFTVLNFLLPERGVLPMHCSANIGADGRVALFFGLSGTGKTTLSADPSRRLIGDDEHGWSSDGVFNFEGGCYAKCIRLSREGEPQIWNAIRFGAVLENVVMDPETRELDFDSEDLTENTRAAYPIEFIENSAEPSLGGHPSHILFLSADAFGVLPPISRLTPEQAMYYFLSGYTAKVAGTERGLGKEPSATFSACFGAPFLPRHPHVYAQMLGEKMLRHHAACYLVNTGWTGGPYGTGRRMSLTHTRAMVRAAVEGRLDNVETRPDPVFRLAVPVSCPDVPASVLDPRGQWADPAAYDQAAASLLARFRENFQAYSRVWESLRLETPAL